MGKFKSFVIAIIILTLTILNIYLYQNMNNLNKKLNSLKIDIDNNKPILKVPYNNEELTSVNIFKSTSQSVVFVTNIQLRRNFFSLNAYKIPKGTGSGFIWDREGRIVTNYHVIESAGEIEITLSNHSVWPAEVIGIAPEKDLAVLKIDAPSDLLKPLQLGSSKDLLVGQKVFAIGNPFGLDQTMTSGIISALNREIQAANGRTIQGVIQTDAAINPGNSGGPLLSSKGELIGVNTAIYSPVGVNSGIGFAVPVDIVSKVIPELIVYGKLIKPGLDITIADQRVVERIGIKGVLIVDVYPGGNAYRAGLRGTELKRGSLVLGDVIIEINDIVISDNNDYLNALDKFNVGDEVELGIIRNRVKKQIKVKLKAQG